MKAPTPSSLAGSTLVEASIAACTAAFFLGSLFTMNMTGLRAVRTAREASSASQVLQQRVESLRIANWQQITNARWLRDNLLSTSASGTDNLRGVSETLTLVPYGSSTLGNTQISRSAGTAKIVNENPALLTESAVKVIWTVAYNGGQQGDSTIRQTVAILGKGGVAKW